MAFAEQTCRGCESGSGASRSLGKEEANGRGEGEGEAGRHRYLARSTKGGGSQARGDCQLEPSGVFAFSPPPHLKSTPPMSVLVSSQIMAPATAFFPPACFRSQLFLKGLPRGGERMKTREDGHVEQRVSPRPSVSVQKLPCKHSPVFARSDARLSGSRSWSGKYPSFPSLLVLAPPFPSRGSSS